MNDLNKYIAAFSNLHVKITNGIKSPNKAIMLLSVIDLIRSGYITTNTIELDSTIEDAFICNWRSYVSTENKSYPWTPFWHLNNEFFWHFQPIRNMSEITDLVKPGQTASLKQMKSVVKYVFLDNQLFLLLKNKASRDRLIEVLIESLNNRVFY